MTVTDLATRAMFDLGLLQEGEVPSPSQLVLIMDALNEWLDWLATQSLSVYSVTRTTWTITSAASYTIGAGGDINVARPVNPEAISNIGYVNGSFPTPVELQLGPPLTDDMYAAIPMKTYPTPYPTNFYYRPTFPLGTLLPYPVPSASLLTGVIYTQAALSEFTSATQTIALPNGYRRYLRASLAIEIAPIFNAEPSPALIKRLSEGEAGVKRANQRLSDMSSDASVLFRGRGRSNIYTGTT